MNQGGPVIQNIKSYKALETKRDVGHSVEFQDKGKQKEIGIRINEPTKVIQIYDSMSLTNIELGKKRKEKEDLARKLEIAKNEATIFELNNKIKFLEIVKKQSVAMPKGNGFENADQDTTQVPLSFLSSSSQKADLNKPFGDASTSNANDNARRNVPYPPRIDLQRRHVQLEGYRQICFDGIPGFPNPIPQEMRKRLPKFAGNNVVTCEDHLRSFLDMMSDYEIEAEDVMMKLFVQSLTEDAREWFKRLPELSIMD